jgi:predicted ATPase
MLTDDTHMRVHFADGLGYAIANGEEGLKESVLANGSTIVSAQGPRGWNVRGLLHSRGPEGAKPPLSELRKRLTVATMVRFDPDYLRAPAPLIPESRGIAFADERGTGLAGVFDAIQNRNNDAFREIQNRVRELFPTVAGLGLINVSGTLKNVAVTLSDTNSTRVGAQAMSEGLLYYLGFAALKHVSGSLLFLVEEPENGLHPTRIAEVVSVLREMSKTNQIVIATHSPLVVTSSRGTRSAS